jgi:hypothetical protein
LPHPSCDEFIVTRPGFGERYVLPFDDEAEDDDGTGL